MSSFRWNPYSVDEGSHMVSVGGSPSFSQHQHPKPVPPIITVDGTETIIHSRYTSSVSHDSQDSSSLAIFGLSAPDQQQDTMMMTTMQQQERRHSSHSTLNASIARRSSTLGDSVHTATTSSGSECEESGYSGAAEKSNPHFPSSIVSRTESNVSNHNAAPAAAAPQQQQQSIQAYNFSQGVSWVKYVRSAPSDTLICTIIGKSTPTVKRQMLDAILLPIPAELSNISTHGYRFIELCMKDRGNVLVQLLTHLVDPATGATNFGPDAVDLYFSNLVRCMETHWEQLTSSQFGAIALTRLFQTMPPTPYQQQIMRLTLVSAVPLSLHPFGNFMVSEALKAAASSPLGHFQFVFEEFAAQWSNCEVFVSLGESRFGSHVVEAFLAAAPSAYVYQLCYPLLTTPRGLEVCRYLAGHKQGNYPLQALFKAISKHSGFGDKSLQEMCCIVVKDLLPACAQSGHHKNLSRAIAAPTTATSSPKSKNSGSSSTRQQPNHVAHHHQVLIPVFPSHPQQQQAVVPIPHQQHPFPSGHFATHCQH